MLNKKVIESIAICGMAALMTITAVTNSGISGEVSENKMLANTGLENGIYAGVTAKIQYDFLNVDNFSIEKQEVDMVAASQDQVSTDEESTEMSEEEAAWQSNLMANVEESLNVRAAADENSDVVGKLYKGSVATITGTEGEWYAITSGNVVGYVNSAYCLVGSDALKYAYEACGQKAQVNVDGLRVRDGQSEDSGVIAVLDTGATLQVDSGRTAEAGWTPVIYNSVAGYVSTDYVTVSLDVGVGRTIEEEQAIIAAQKAAEEKAAAQKAAQKAKEESSSSGSSATRTQGSSLAASADEVTLLAAIIQCEAGGCSYETQLAVGACVVNRVKAGYADGTIYGVIFQKGQFGPASSGKLERRLAQGVSSTSYAAAQEALSGVDNTNGALNFRDGSSSKGVTYGSMYFY